VPNHACIVPQAREQNPDKLLGGGEPLVPLPPLNEVLLAGGNLVVVRDHPDCAEIVDVTDADIAYVNDLIAEALDFPR
jgi:hypothetical protein